MSEERYVQLVDWTGRRLCDDKAGAIPADLAPLLERLELDVENWVSTVERYGSLYYRVVGKLDKVREAAKRAGPSSALRATEGRQRWFRRADREACTGVYPERPPLSTPVGDRALDLAQIFLGPQGSISVYEPS